MLSTLVDLAARTPVPWLVIVVAALVLVCESGSAYGILLPGSTVAAGLGLWSALGGHSTVACMAAAATGTVTGAHIGWCRGRRGVVAPAQVARSARVLAAVERARGWVGGRSGPATSMLVTAGHWASALRPLSPRIAASSGVRYRWAGPVLVLSGAAWATTLVGLGAWVGPEAAAHVEWVGPPVVVAVVAVLVVRAARARRAATPSGGTTPVPAGREVDDRAPALSGAAG